MSGYNNYNSVYNQQQPQPQYAQQPQQQYAQQPQQQYAQQPQPQYAQQPYKQPRGPPNVIGILIAKIIG